MAPVSPAILSWPRPHAAIVSGALFRRAGRPGAIGGHLNRPAHGAKGMQSRRAHNGPARRVVPLHSRLRLRSTSSARLKQSMHRPRCPSEWRGVRSGSVPFRVVRNRSNSRESARKQEPGGQRAGRLGATGRRCRPALIRQRDLRGCSAADARTPIRATCSLQRPPADWRFWTLRGGHSPRRRSEL
jgi:hypothetical protein